MHIQHEQEQWQWFVMMMFEITTTHDNVEYRFKADVLNISFKFNAQTRGSALQYLHYYIRIFHQEVQLMWN